MTVSENSPGAKSMSRFWPVKRSGGILIKGLNIRPMGVAKSLKSARIQRVPRKPLKGLSLRALVNALTMPSLELMQTALS